MYGFSPSQHSVDWSETFTPDGNFYLRAGVPNTSFVRGKSGFPNFPGHERKEVFYSIKDGDWNDQSVWFTASGRIGLLPTVYDDVYIRHSINVARLQSAAYAVNNLFIASSGYIYANINFSLWVYGNLKSRGIIDSFNAHLFLFKSDNYIDRYINTDTGIGSINYMGFDTESIMPLTYRNLGIGSSANSAATNTYDIRTVGSIKKLSAHTIVTGNLNVNYARFDTYGFDLYVGGQTSLNGNNASGGEYNFQSSAFSNIIFNGELRATAIGYPNCFDVSVGNPNIECRGGIDVYRNQQNSIKCGTGVWKFTTNNQTIRSTAGANGYLRFSGDVIVDNINLTVDVNTIVELLNPINATNAGNTLINKGTINFFTAVAATDSMVTGIFDITSFVNTIGYTGNYSVTMRSDFPTYSNLTITGTGTKTLYGDTILNANLVVSSGSTGNLATLQLSTFNFTVTGTTTQGAYGAILKSGSGNILFVGFVQLGGAAPANFDLSAGNPIVEVRNGFQFNNYFGTFSSGTGLWSFTTNSQNLHVANSAVAKTWNAPMSIVGAITLTVLNGDWSVYNITNGTVAGSRLLLNGCYWKMYDVVCEPIMSTGVLDLTTAAKNLIGFNWDGDYSIPIRTYSCISCYGTGVKSLQTNTTMAGMTLNHSSGYFDCGAYNLTLTGIQDFLSPGNFVSLYLAGSGAFKKTGTGALIFGGTVYSSTPGGIIDLSGNPTVECKNGIWWDNPQNTFVSGTGLWTFSTNNQEIRILYAASDRIIQNMLISGAITVTVYASNAAYLIVYSLDGNNANSLFVNNSLVRYQGAAAPMNTGLLYANQTTNTFNYDAAFNQDIKVPNDPTNAGYKNLTLAGSGAKRLLGNVSVKGTYILSAPATLDSNGFSLTNP